MMKKWFRYIGIALLVALLVIQFIHPARNNGEVWGGNNISKLVPVPDEVKQVLDVSCNDCHSNRTLYPWYSYIQPIGFWLDNHVNDGKRHLNFSEYTTYKRRRVLHKLEEIWEQVEQGEMPLSSYTLIHHDAKLTPAQAGLLINWAKQSYELLKLRTDTLANGQLKVDG